jgi:hypothetical protein
MSNPTAPLSDGVVGEGTICSQVAFELFRAHTDRWIDKDEHNHLVNCVLAQQEDLLWCAAVIA